MAAADLSGPFVIFTQCLDLSLRLSSLRTFLPITVEVAGKSRCTPRTRSNWIPGSFASEIRRKTFETAPESNIFLDWLGSGLCSKHCGPVRWRPYNTFSLKLRKIPQTVDVDSPPPSVEGGIEMTLPPSFSRLPILWHLASAFRTCLPAVHNVSIPGRTGPMLRLYHQTRSA